MNCFIYFQYYIVMCHWSFAALQTMPQFRNALQRVVWRNLVLLILVHSQTWHVIEILLHSDHAYRIYVGETFFKCFRSMRLLCINIYKTKIVSIWKFFSRCCWMYCIVCCCCPLLSKMSVLSVVTFDWKLKEKLEKQEKIQRNKCVERINSKKNKSNTMRISGYKSFWYWNEAIICVFVWHSQYTLHYRANFHIERQKQQKNR